MIHLLVTAALLAQAGTAQTPPVQRPVPQRRTIVTDSTNDTTRNRQLGRRKPVTAALLASAFKDEATRDLFNKARRTRLKADSTLRNYDAIARSRMSVDLGIGNTGREHLFYRQESAARVQWQRDIGVWIDLTGARVGIPMAPKEAEVDALLGELNSMSPIPYFPGYEALWTGDEATARVDANERDIVNPLAVGAEAYFTYARGDSVSFTLQDGTKIRLQEIEFRPRQVNWNLAVGSLWFDTNGQLVKAVYRLSSPIDMWTAINDEAKNNNNGADPKDGVPAIISGFLSPIQAQITGVAIEYSLHGLYWLPRLRSIEGNAQVLFAKVPMQMDQRFEYKNVNGPDTLPVIDTLRLPPLTFRQPPPRIRDSLRVADSTRRARQAAMTPAERAADRAAIQQRRDSVSTANSAANKQRDEERNKRIKAVSDSLERGLPATGVAPGTRAARECDTSGVRTAFMRRYETRMPVAVRIPCDLNKLTHSPDLPKSIYDPGEELFSTKDRDEMMSQALDMAAQAPISIGMLPRPQYVWGPNMTRYNRVEGLSTGFSVTQELGGGLSVGALGRFGFADKDPNVEITGARTNLTKTVRLTGYHHLVSASDWGNPLSFGASFGALLFGKDDGVYYRSTGAEAKWTRGVNSKVEWRVFGEQQKTAVKQTHFAFFSKDTLPSNLTANEGVYFGGGLHLVHNHGADPRGFQSFSDLRLEAARGDSLYGRAAGELSISMGTPLMTAVSLTLAAGSSLGFLPAQRRWYLGGTQTIRGQGVDVTYPGKSGDAFWLTRLELAKDHRVYKSAIFADLGWAGNRNNLTNIGRPIAGVGYGSSSFQGLLRYDIAYGLYPSQPWKASWRPPLRFDFYLDARF